MVFTRSYLPLIATAFFALFLIASPPHRVHHFFEEHRTVGHSHSHAHTHDHAQQADHHDHDQPKAPDCSLQVVAQHASAALFHPVASPPRQRAQVPLTSYH